MHACLLKKNNNKKHTKTTEYPVALKESEKFAIIVNKAARTVLCEGNRSGCFGVHLL